MGERYTAKEGYSLIVVSDWLPLTDGKFSFEGKQYSLADFEWSVWPSMFYDEEGKLHHISCWERDEWQHPLGIEFEDAMEWLRLFKEE